MPDDDDARGSEGSRDGRYILRQSECVRAIWRLVRTGYAALVDCGDFISSIGDGLNLIAPRPPVLRESMDEQDKWQVIAMFTHMGDVELATVGLNQTVGPRPFKKNA